MDEEGAGESRGWLGERLSKLIAPVLQPKFAMGMAMTILSFSMLVAFVPVRQIEARGSAAGEVWAGLDDRAHRAWARTVKYYENLKLVYQIQTMLRDWQQQAEEQKAAQACASRSRTTGSCR